jgi:hypothetical protein
MKNIIVILLLTFSVSGFAQNEIIKNKSFCNPINLNYRFQLKEPSRREAADPVVIVFNDKYYLFASKSGGYWSSDNLIDWSFFTTQDLPIEEYAPAVAVIDDAVYYTALNKKIYKSTNPEKGKWTIAKDSLAVGSVGDPAFFLDDDGRFYLFSGISNFLPLYGIELDRNTFNPIGEQTGLFSTDIENHGWERNGDYNTEKKKKPFLEGIWVNKFNGKYYAQYAVPGTSFKSYSDGCYISDNPLGPYKLLDNNPFSYKPEGFIAGAGHSSTFTDKWGNIWHAATMVISVKDTYERRIGFFPAFIDKDDILYTYTAFGDFPHIMPQKKLKGPEEYQPVGMLLSYNKPVEVSSSKNGFPKENATNENIRTYWSANTGNKGEWIIIDLEDKCKVSSIQINYAEEDCRLLDRPESDYHQYILEYSNDKKAWNSVIDKRFNKTSIPHDFVELEEGITARYIKLTNHHVPDGKFAISGLRIFGFGNGDKPKAVTTATAERDSTDRCIVSLKWTKSANAIGYNIRYGTDPGKLYLNYQVYDTDNLNINSLNSSLKYYFTVDVFNENGITKGNVVFEM